MVALLVRPETHSTGASVLNILLGEWDKKGNIADVAVCPWNTNPLSGWNALLKLKHVTNSSIIFSSKLYCN